MSNDALTAVWKTRLGNAGAKATLAVLADKAGDHAGEDWTCWPSVETIADLSDQAPRTVERHLAWLEDNGWVRRKRLRRRDGSLAGYKYRLNRPKIEDAARQAEDARRAKKTRVQDPLGWGDDLIEEADEPHANLAGGPAANNDATTRQIVREPHANLAGHEPTIEPLKEPYERGGASASASAKGVVDAVADPFWRAAALCPASAKASFSEPLARAAWALALPQAGAPDRLVEAVRRYAADPVLARRDYGARSLQKFLSEGTWRLYLPEAGWQPGGAVGPAAAAPSGMTFAGPTDLRAAVLEVQEAGWFGSYLGPASWDEASRTLTLRTQTAEEQVRGDRRVMAILIEHRVTLAVARRAAA